MSHLAESGSDFYLQEDERGWGGGFPENLFCMA